MMPAIKKAFDLLRHDIIELSTDEKSLKNKKAPTMKKGRKNLKQNC